MGIVDRLRDDRRLLGVLAAGGAVVLAVGLYLFQPWQLFLDTTVDEALPGTSSSDTTTSGDAPTPPAGDSPVPDDVLAPDDEMSEDMPPDEPVAVLTGAFGPRSHPGSGTATVYELPDGTRVLRFEDLDTDNGPDLFVYLSTASPDAPAGDFDTEFVNLGRLKGNVGDQNYELPDDVDLDRFTTVAIWCDRFDVVFTTAGLASA